MTTVRAVSENGIWAPNPPSVRMRKASIRSTGFCGHRSYFYDPETSDKDGNLQQYQYNGRKLSFDGYFTDELASGTAVCYGERAALYAVYVLYRSHSPNEATEEDLARFEGQPARSMRL